MTETVQVAVSEQEEIRAQIRSALKNAVSAIESGNLDEVWRLVEFAKTRTWALMGLRFKAGQNVDQL